MAFTHDPVPAEAGWMTHLQQAGTLDEVAAAVSQISNHFHFAYYKLYLAPMPGNCRLVQLTQASNMPPSFLEEFDAIGYSYEDLAVLRPGNRPQLARWRIDEILSNGPPEKHEMLVGLLRRHDIDMGAFVTAEPAYGPARILSFLGAREALSPKDGERLTIEALQVLERVDALDRRRRWDKAGLTELELECLELGAQGLGAYEIGRRLGLSGRTVLYLSDSICSKLGVSNIEHAVADALRCGFIR